MEVEKDRAAQFRILGGLNQVHGFDPSVFAEDRTDLTTGSSWKKLPTPIKIAWFRLKYPEGRITVQVTPLKENFMARARIYFNYKDGADEYASEATAYSERALWAQSSAIGFALNYAGFGSQYSVFDSNEDEEPSDGLCESMFDDGASEETLKAITETISASDETEDRELTLEEKYDKALATLYPFAKYLGKTLKEVMDTDFAAIEYLSRHRQSYERRGKVRRCNRAITCFGEFLSKSTKGMVCEDA